MTTTSEDHGRLNVFAKEPQMEIIEVNESHNERAEMLNGRLAMLGVSSLHLVPMHSPGKSFLVFGK